MRWLFTGSPIFSLLRLFQLEGERQRNEMQALAPGSMHPRVSVPTVVMAIGALLALFGLFAYWPLIPIGIAVFVVSLAYIVVQAVIDTLRSG